MDCSVQVFSLSTHAYFQYTQTDLLASKSSFLVFVNILYFFLSAKFCGAFFSNTIKARTLKFGMCLDTPPKLCISFGIVKMFKIMQIRALHIYVYSIL